MTYSFGWWGFTDGDEPLMVCRDSDERVVMVGELAEPWLGKAMADHPNRPSDRWKRFEYRHEEFWFPLIVNWLPEEGKILIDYNLSSALWREETNETTDYPPYGGWVRVDDMVPDAFWCWPGVVSGYLPKDISGLRQKDWFDSIEVQGGYLNGKWRKNLCIWDSLTHANWSLIPSAYLHTELRGKPKLCDLSFEDLELLKRDDVNLYEQVKAVDIFRRELNNSIKTSADIWGFTRRPSAKHCYASVSNSNKALKISEFIGDWCSAFDPARAVYICDCRRHVHLVFGSVNALAWGESITNRKIQNPSFVYINFGMEDTALSQQQFSSSMIFQVSRECIDATSCWEWDHQYAWNPRSNFDGWATCFSCLGGAFFEFRTRLFACS